MDHPTPIEPDIAIARQTMIVCHPDRSIEEKTVAHEKACEIAERTYGPQILDKYHRNFKEKIIDCLE